MGKEKTDTNGWNYVLLQNQIYKNKKFCMFDFE